MKLQKLGGYATFASVCGYIVLVVFSIIRIPRLGDLNDPITAMAAISTSPFDFYMINLLLMISTILWMIAILALNERMQANAPNLTRITTIAASVATAAIIFMATAGVQSIDLIASTKDVSAYRAFNTMTSSMFDTSGHAFGWACLLAGCAVLKTGVFSRFPAWLFILAGILWVRIPIPINRGLSYLPYPLWLIGFIWFGIELLRQKRPGMAITEIALLA